MDTVKPPPPLVVNQADVAEIVQMDDAHWGSAFKPLTPALDTLGEQERRQRPRLGMNLSRVPPGRSGCPFHAHAREDEVFYVLSGRGLFRYGAEVMEVGPGDCIACPAGTGIAHQLANPFDEDLVYLGVGLNDGHEVCTYPDSGKVMVRSLQRVGLLEATDYMQGEEARPRLLDMVPTRPRGAR
ncbi:MAG: cupin domain-containing protein [Rubrivivax sp.]|nr:cupin domain-containing protein [Rubrivivax sp.]